MSTWARLIGIALLSIALAYLGGCAFLRGSAAGSAFVANDMRHLRLPGADESQQRAVAYRSPFGYQEYDRSQTNGRAEALFLQATTKGTSVDISSQRLRSLTGRWSFNRHGAQLAWEKGQDRRLATADLRYHRYRHTGPHGAPSRHCVAFIRTWAFQSLDPLNRPGKAYFGYVCRPPARPLSVTDAERYLRRIEIATPRLVRFHLGQTVPRDAKAPPTVRGRGHSAWGLADFPLHKIAHYPLGGSYDSGR